MKLACVLVALIGVVATFPQGVAANNLPKGSAPDGCLSSYEGEFQIDAVRVTSKRDLVARGFCGSDGSLTLKLTGGVVTDAKGRIGAIVANYQFQFDGPPAQADAIFTAGWSVCANGSLALGNSTVFYECQSGTFYNLYDRKWAPQCSPVELVVLACSSSGPLDTITSTSDSRAQETFAAQTPEGEPQATSAFALSEKSDGQPQIPTGALSETTDINDSQLQTPSATSTGQISVGQGQAPTTIATMLIYQTSDGQAQTVTATSTVPISQISDAQIHIETATTVPTTVPTQSQIASSIGAATLFKFAADIFTILSGVAAFVLL